MAWQKLPKMDKHRNMIRRKGDRMMTEDCCPGADCPAGRWGGMPESMGFWQSLTKWAIA
jgi:hypothetical protein